jgi:hypothetical protein
MGILDGRVTTAMAHRISMASHRSAFGRIRDPIGASRRGIHDFPNQDIALLLRSFDPALGGAALAIFADSAAGVAFSREYSPTP